MNRVDSVAGALAADEPRTDAGAWEQSVHRLFAEQAARTPDATVLAWDGGTLTFAQLDARASRLANLLRRRGVSAGGRVGFCLERGPDSVVTMLAALKAGAAYVPLDAAYPAERLAYMLADSGIRTLVTQRTLAAALPADGIDVVVLDEADEALAAECGEDPGIDLGPDALAYVIYTSGSTGRPKGVAVPHRGILRLVLDGGGYAELGAEQVFLQLSPVSFDTATLEVWAPLLNGGRLAFYPPHQVNPRELGEVLRRHSVTTLWLTSGVFHLCADEDPSIFGGLRQLLAGGDVLSVPHARRIARACPGVRLINGYGPTENTTFTTCHTARPHDLESASFPIGIPVAGTTAWVVDGEMRLTGEGELLTGGAGLAWGYLGRPALTAEKWIPDPFSGVPGARLFRTGDQVRWMEDGVLEFIGRIDEQVKVRGFRIELGEIEAALREHAGVGDAAVAARPGPDGQKRLIGYVVAKDGTQPGAAALRETLGKRLPAHMVPAVFVPVDALPLSPNGKVDRRALPAPPERPEELEAELVAPRTETEAAVAEIWAEVLGLDAVGVEDDVFALGAHSLAVTQAAARVRARLGVELPFRDLFAARTVAALARAVERRRAEAAANPESAAATIPRASRDARLPLSFSQERIWFLLQLAPENLSYNFQATLTCRGRLDREALRYALEEIVRRHEIFRTTFPADRGEPFQQVHPPFAPELPLIDLSGVDAEARAEEERRILREAFAEVFGITRLPLVRWRLIRRAEDEHVLVHVEHHMVHDGWSFNVFLRELLSIYGARTQGLPSPLPELPLQFGDYAYWQRGWLGGAEAGRQLAFWSERLAGSSHVLEMAFDRPRPEEQRFRGAAPRYELPAELYERLRAAGRRGGVTLFATMMAAFNVLLWRWSGQTDLNVGTGIANRRAGEIQELMGMFVNSVVVRTRLDDDPAFIALARRVHAEIVAAAEHQEMPFEAVVEAVRPARSLRHNPLFQASFSFHDAPIPALELPELAVEVAPGLSNGSAKFDLNIIVIPRAEQRVGQGRADDEDGITLIWEYSSDLFDAATIDRMVAQYRGLLEAAAAEPETPVSRLPVPPVHPDHPRPPSVAVASAAGRGAADDGGPRTIHRRVRAQAERTPDAVALRADEASVSYRALEDRANRLARHLVRLGVGPEVRVGVCLERGVEMVVGQLAALKAGGAYVPMDALYPPARLAFMLADSGAAVLVTRDGVLERLEVPAGVRVVRVDGDAAAIAAERAEAPVDRASARNLAYVIYTSGSTGRPKGAGVEHAGLSGFCDWHLAAHGVTAADRGAQMASAGFDAAAWDVWPYLACGASVDVVPEEVRGHPGSLRDWLVRRGITLTFAPPAIAEPLLALAWPRGTALRWLMAAGDRLRVRPGPAIPFRVTNNYGPTECTILSTSGPVAPEGQGLPDIGRPVAGAAAHVLDEAWRPLPAGAEGELFVGGAAVGRGYLGHPALTAVRFVPDPFSAEPGARMYRTGDRVRPRPDGAIDFVGRADHQVKVRGIRIEPGEIEAALRRHPDVEDCVVVAREEGGETRLVAYVAGGAGADALRALLRASLPEHMVPSAFVALDALPLSPNGKVDRRALPAPPLAPRVDARSTGGLRTPLEERVAEVWKEVLRIPVVGAEDSFFDVGGTSLHLPRVHSRLAERHPELRMADLFRHLTVSELAAFLAARQGNGGMTNGAPSLEAVERQVADAWREVLRIPAVGPDDNFFDLGGTSLYLARVHNRLLPLHGGLRIADLFRHPTVASLARFLAEANGNGGSAANGASAPSPESTEGAAAEAGVARASAASPVDSAAAEPTTADGDADAWDGTSRGAVEEHVAEVWRTVLGQIAVQVQDNFFDLGGTSLLMYRVFTRLRTLQPALKVTDLFRAPTVEGHAALLRPAAVATVDEDFPAAPAQPIDRSAEPVRSAPPAAGIPTRRPASIDPGDPAQSAPAAAGGAPAPVAREQDPDAVRELIARQLDILRSHTAIMQTQLELLRRNPRDDVPPADDPGSSPARAAEPPTPDPVPGMRAASPSSPASGSNGGADAPSGVAGTAAALDVAAAMPPGESGGDVRVLPASFAQEQLWLIDQMQPGLPIYSIRSGFRLHGVLDAAALERALGEVVRRHDALRTTMAEVDGAPVQLVHPFAGFRLPLTVLPADAPGREAWVRERVRMQAEQPLDLAAGPVFRAELLRLAEEEHVLLLCVHHAVADGWSLGVLYAELAELYAAAREGRAPPLAPVTMQFADFARLQREQANTPAMLRGLAYWRARLAGAPALLELPADFPRPPAPSYRGAHESIELPVQVLDALRALSRAEHASPFMVLLAAFQALVARLSRRGDVVVGTAAAGRAHRDARDAVGMFANLLALRTDLGGDPSFREVLSRVRATVLGAMDHQEAPFGRVVQVARPERAPGHAPLVQVVFTMEDAGHALPALPGLRVERVEMAYPAAKFDLVLMVETEAAFRAGIVYRTDLFRPATVRRMLAAYQRVLEQAAADPGVRLSALALEAGSREGDRSADAVPLPDPAEADGLHPAETTGAADAVHRPRSPATEGVWRPPPSSGKDGGAMPLSFAQERLWFLDRMEPESAFYNIPAARRLEGALDVPALERALGEIVRRHDSLRTTFHAVDGSPVQVAAPFAGFTLAVEDLAALEPAAREAQARRRVDEDAARPFDLEAGPPFRAALLRLAEDAHVLLLCLHHIAGDGWSLDVLFRELDALYQAFAAGAAPPPAEPAVRYADFAARQRRELRGEALERPLAYWRARLAGAPALLEVPTDRPRPAVQTHRGAQERIDLPPALLDALRAAGRAEGVTPYIVILAAFQALLAKYARSEDVVVGSMIAGRTRAEVEEVIGLFVNTLVLRTDLSGDPPFRQLLLRVRETALGAWEHQELPFERLVAELRPERSPSHAPLCQVAFSLGDAPAAAPALGRVRMTPVDAEQATAKFDLGLGVLVGEGCFRATLSYATELFDRATAARMLRQLARVLEQVAADPDRRLSGLDLLSDDERRQVVGAWSDGEPVPPSAACVHDLFAAQAARTPDAVAVVHPAARLSYRELDARSARLARHLRGLGVRPETRVGVCLERTPELAVALLGILRAGGAYVPLDPAYPQERLGWMMEDAEARLVITSSPLAARLPQAAEPVFIDALDGVLDAGPSTAPESGTDPENLSHLIFTSGSTGRPKGVMIRHAATVARLLWLREAYSAEERAAVAASTSINFDVSVPEIFGTLCWGGTLVLLENALELPSIGVPVTMAGMVPTAAAELLRAGGIPASVRTLNLAGEPLAPALAAAAHASGTLRRLLNLYGPTEDTSYSTWSEVGAGADRVRIGRPLAGSRAYVLDAALRPVPPGVPGELYLAGAGIARGYARRPSLTAESYLPDPYGPPGTRMYRVRDLARWTDRGELECLGRTDFQVKVRGYRIEPGEIEAVLREHAEVDEAAVVAREDATGGPRLVAYVTGGAEPAALRAHLRRRVPEYMVPSAWVALDALPRTPNGKLDRRALPAPAAPAQQGRRLEPETEAEARLVAVWKELLGVESLGVEDNFFDRGGHSLLLVRLQSRLAAELGCEMSVIELFQYATVRALAARLQGRGPAPQGTGVEMGEGRGAARQAGLGRLARGRRAEPSAEGAGAPVEERAGAFAPPRSHASVPAFTGAEKTYPASFAQERLWFLDRLQPGSPAYNTIAAQRIEGELDVAALERALGEIVRRHEVLRTTFGEVDGAPVQVVAPFTGLRLPVEELSALAPAEREARVDRWIQAEARRAPDLREPLFRPRLLRLGLREHVLLLPVHHLVGDGPGMGVLAREMFALYAAFHAGRPSPLPPLPAQYGDFALAQRGQLRDGVLERQLAYWRERLAGAPARLDLPTDFPRPAVQEYRGDSEHVRLSPALMERLRALAAEERCTPFMVMLAALGVLLSRYGGTDDVVVGTPISSRTRPEFQELIGYFANMLPLRTDLRGDPGFRALLLRVRTTMVGAFANAEVPFERLVQELAPGRTLDRMPLFQVIIVSPRADALDADLPGLVMRQVHFPATVSKCDLMLAVAAHAGEVWLTYDTDLFRPETAAGMVDDLRRVLEQAAADPDVRLSAMALPGAERAAGMLAGHGA